MWHTDDTAPWVLETIKKVRLMWRQQYKPLHRASTTATCLRLYDNDSAFSRLANAKRLRIDAPYKQEDAFEDYLSMDTKQHDDSKSFDIIGWWQQRQQRFPGLARIAFDVFLIPLMSDDSERSFSSGRDMITYRRTKLRSDIIEACQCLKSWYGNNEDLFDDKEAIQIDMDAVDDAI